MASASTAYVPLPMTPTIGRSDTPVQLDRLKKELDKATHDYASAYTQSNAALVKLHSDRIHRLADAISKIENPGTHRSASAAVASPTSTSAPAASAPAPGTASTISQSFMDAHPSIPSPPIVDSTISAPAPAPAASVPALAPPKTDVLSKARQAVTDALADVRPTSGLEEPSSAPVAATPPPAPAASAPAGTSTKNPFGTGPDAPAKQMRENARELEIAKRQLMEAIAMREDATDRKDGEVVDIDEIDRLIAIRQANLDRIKDKGVPSSALGSIDNPTGVSPPPEPTVDFSRENAELFRLEQQLVERKKDLDVAKKNNNIQDTQKAQLDIYNIEQAIGELKKRLGLDPAATLPKKPAKPAMCTKDIEDWLDNIVTPNNPTWVEYNKFSKESKINSKDIDRCIKSRGGTIPKIPNPSGTKPAGTPPGPAPAPAPAAASVTSSIVVSQKCRNVISYLVRGKKSLTYKEYYDIWSDGTADISQEEVDECLKQHGIPIPEACTPEIEDWLDNLPNPNFPSVKEFNEFIITSGNIPDQVINCIRTRGGDIIAKGTKPAGTTPAGTPPPGTTPAGTPLPGTKPAGTPPPGTPPPAKLSKADLIKLGRDSYKELEKTDPHPDDTVFLNQIPSLFSKFSSCIDVKNFLTEDHTPSKDYELLKDETVDYWNIMNAYLQINGKPDEEQKWTAVDTQYEKLAEARRLTKFNKYEDKFDKDLMRGGVKTKQLSTDIFNKSLIANDDIEIAKFNRSISRTEKKLMDEINYFDRKYSLGLQNISKSTSSKAKEDSKYIDELLDEVYDQEKKKSKYIEDIAHPEHRFEKILKKFKTESQLISWLEKAKVENIKFTAESKKANQKLKTLTIIKESVDKCIKNMKKSLNYKCENISKYRTILDKSKQLELKQKTILDLSAFMIDPGRGVDNAREAMDSMGVDAISDGLKKYVEALKMPVERSFNFLFTLPDVSGVVNGFISSKPAFQKIYEDPLLVKITFITPEIVALKQIVEDEEHLKILKMQKTIPDLKNFLENNFIELYLGIRRTIHNKINFLNSILTTKSSAPILSEILRTRQETGNLRENIKDTLEELEEAKQTPVDVSKCIDDYKKVISKENVDLEKELDRIDTVTEDYLKKVPQAIEEIKNQIKVNLNQGGPGGQGQGQGQGQGNKNYSTMNKEQLEKEKEGEQRGIVELRSRLNNEKTSENEKKKLPGRIKGKEDLIRTIQRELDKRNNTPKSGGGLRAYAHSTRRYIKR